MRAARWIVRLERPLLGLLAMGFAGACASAPVHRHPSRVVAPEGGRPSAVNLDTASAASPEPVVADQRAFTEGAEVLRGGRLQLEMGDRLVHRSGPGGAAGDVTESSTSGEVLVRVAAGSRAEVRVAPGALVHARSPGERHSGRADGVLGAKFLLVPESHGRAWIPSAALVLETSLPTGSAEFTHATAEPEAKLALGWALPHGWQVASNVNVARLREHEHRATEWAYGAALSHHVAGPVRGLVEAFARRPEQGATRGFGAAGVAVSLGRHAELDAEVGHGLGVARHDYFLNIGAARRW